ncbi:MAG: hypothetical protein ACJAX3_001980, partial [Patiriisocius sp.]
TTPPHINAIAEMAKEYKPRQLELISKSEPLFS